MAYLCEGNANINCSPSRSPTSLQYYPQQNIFSNHSSKKIVWLQARCIISTPCNKTAPGQTNPLDEQLKEQCKYRKVCMNHVSASQQPVESMLCTFIQYRVKLTIFESFHLLHIHSLICLSRETNKELSWITNAQIKFHKFVSKTASHDSELNR
jgi:hypothetical protein